MEFVYIGIALAAVVIALVVFISLRPADFRITRWTKFSAPPAAVFAQVNDFHNWDGWSPWAKMDPTMKQTYEGAPAGTGAIYSWVGNKKVGQGRMTILESRPSEMVQIRLEFLKPFKATNTAEFTFKAEGDQTKVIWSMFGKKGFMFKAFGMLMDMDKMIGGDFEKGLAAMKAVVEGTGKG